MKADGRRRLRIWLAAACFLAAIVTWNGRFDAAVYAAAEGFVHARERWSPAQGPSPEMIPWMRDATRRAARSASIAAAPFAAAGCLLLALGRGGRTLRATPQPPA